MSAQEESTGSPVQKESTYTSKELIAASYAAFNVPPEVVAGALKMAGKDAMTKAEAESAIKAFLKKEVK